MEDDEVLTDTPWYIRMMAALEELSGAIIIVVSLVSLGVLAQAWVRGSMW